MKHKTMYIIERIPLAQGSAKQNKPESLKLFPAHTRAHRFSSVLVFIFEFMLGFFVRFHSHLCRGLAFQVSGGLQNLRRRIPGA